MSDPIQPRVFLVGAGPGDPGLLTLRAVECLARADLVLYDKLVPPRLLNFAPPAAERVCVADVPGGHPHRWPFILQRLVDAAKEGKVVVRLKGGDPLVFGRGAEEAEELKKAGIVYEIVPGVTAVSAAAAAAEIPVTHRGYASAVALVTGHENPTKSHHGLDWSALARFPGTLAVYMGMARLDLIARVLIDHGKSPTTPAAVIAAASTGEQRRVHAPLAELAEAARGTGLHAPALIVIGPAAGQAPELSWFERRPLFGKRVLVTRPREQATDLVRQLEILGAVPLVLPAVAIEPLDDWTEVDTRLASLGYYDWLVFTSVNGVRAFFGRLRATGRDLRALGEIKLAAIGPGTAEALREYHLDADVVPAEYRSESLAAALAEKAAGKRILLARADRGRDVLRDELSQVSTVDQVAVYRQTDAVPADSPALDTLRRGEIDYVLLTSSNVARAFLVALDDVCRGRIRDGHTRLVTISPVTTAAVTALDFAVAAEARIYTTDGLLQAVVEDVSSR
jgi:uroporphyrinogen III methyltransferase/synthase